MKIKEAVHKTCGECERQIETISDEVFGCDRCKKPIQYAGDNGKRHHDYLEITVYREPMDTKYQHLQFCSWQCVFEFLPTIKCDYFISLPTVSYEKDSVKGQRNSDFIKLVKAATKH